MLKYIIFLFSPLIGFSQSIDDGHQLLWEISGNGLEKNAYLFGSFHNNDRRVFNLSDSTYIALNNVDAVVLETDIFGLFEELDVREGFIRVKYDKDGNPYTASKRASSTVYGDEDGMPQFLDAYFQQYCYNAGKKFHPLETIDSQLNFFDNAEPSSNEMRYESLFVTREDILETYLKGDIYDIDEMLRLSLSLSEGFYESLIIERNYGMSARLDSLLKADQSIFCAVGAGHLAGNEGMISLLQKKGYKVRKVLATYGEDVSLDKLEVKNQKTFLYENDSIGFQVAFPGKPAIVEDDFWGEVNFKLIYRDFGQGNTYSVEIYDRNDDASLLELADVFIASPSESPYRKIKLDNGGEAYEGLSDSYPEGLFWTRIIMAQDYFLVLKSYGGNKFMNSNRAQRFFNKVWLN
tara:strand:+ start:2301 stop:3521 length:1221 start_codon:yes stop_codon:yes gene_type:complete